VAQRVRRQLCLEASLPGDAGDDLRAVMAVDPSPALVTKSGPNRKGGQQLTLRALSERAHQAYGATGYRQLGGFGETRKPAHGAGS